MIVKMPYYKNVLIFHSRMNKGYLMYEELIRLK